MRAGAGFYGIGYRSFGNDFENGGKMAMGRMGVWVWI